MGKPIDKTLSSVVVEEWVFDAWCVEEEELRRVDRAKTVPHTSQDRPGGALT